jgi:hypothetical protein
MSSIKTVPVTWTVQRLMCDCGGEFQHKFSIKYKAKPFVHVCDRCNATEDTESIYPMTTYQEV